MAHCVKCTTDLETKDVSPEVNVEDTKKITCKICNRGFLNKASLLGHRYRIHRDVLGNTEKCYFCPNCNRSFTSRSRLHTHTRKYHRADVKSAMETDNLQTSSVPDKSQEDLGEKARASVLKQVNQALGFRTFEDALGAGVEKIENSRKDETGGSRVYKKLSDIHDILKIISNDGKTAFSFVTCYSMKSVFDGLVPEVFESEIVMKDILTQQQYIYSKIIRETTNLLDVHAVFNETASQEILLDILTLIRNRTFT